MQHVDQATRQATPAHEPINLRLFSELLKDHAEGSVNCKGADSVMLFGSTGVGKSTMLHLLAGAKFSFQAVEVATCESVAGEFDTEEDEYQLVTQTKIPGCVIGNTTSSTTMYLNSHHDPSTGLTYIDTPGFNNVSGGDDDTTIDAANSAAIMSTIRSCSTLRVVFLISVRDELDNARAGAIKKLFELMGKFIKEAEKRLPSVLMLFTHCRGSGFQEIIGFFKRIGRANSLPENLMPFLKHAIHLLNTHQEALVIDPAAEDAQDRMNQVRDLLKTTVEPITDTVAALECPLSTEVVVSLENLCGLEKEQIVLSLQNNRLLTDARSHLDRLRLLHDNLCLKKVEDIYKSALHHIVSQAETRKQLVLEDIQRQSFSQVRTSLSIFNCDLSILSSHMSLIGPGDVLKTLKDVCKRSIQSTCEDYDHNLDENLEKDAFDAAVTVLRHCEGMLEHLKEQLPPRFQEKLSCAARKKLLARTIRNKEKARALIREKQFDAELCRLLNAIKCSSDKFSAAEWPAIHHDQITINETDCLLEADYGVVSAEMNKMLTDIAEEQIFFLKPDTDVSTNIIIKVFIDDESSTAEALSQIDSAYHLCSTHLRDDAKTAREECHKALSGLKDTSFERLRDAIGNFEWKEASSLFDCMQRAGRLGSQEEMRNVESRLEDIQESAKLSLSKLVESLSSDLDRDDFQSFSRREISLRNAIRLPADSGLGRALLLDTSPQQGYLPELQQRRQRMFKADYDLLLGKVNEKFTEAVLKCKTSLQGLDFADVMVRIKMLDKMAEALSVGREPESGCLVPDFNKRLAELLQHFHSDVVDKCKSLVAPRHDPLQYSTESEVAHLTAHWQPVQELRSTLRKHICTLKSEIPMKSQIPSLCMIMRLDTLDLIPHSTAADWDEELFRMLQDAEDHLSRSLQSYARACHDRCLSSLAAEPKPLADDIVNFLNTLTNCQALDPFLASAGLDEGAGGTQPFAEQRKSVRDAVKKKFTEVRDAFRSDVRADRMAAAQANLDWANEMQPLRDEFAGDAITFDTAFQEMKGSFEQKSGTFERKFDNALSQENFPDISKLLRGAREAEQEESLKKVIAAGDVKRNEALHAIGMISTDVRGRTGDFPPSVEKGATSLKWIENARFYLSDGEDPILPAGVSERWQLASQNMTKKLEELLKAGELKLEEWNFATVEEIHRRLGLLHAMGFPVEISGTIERMQSELSAALDAKVAGLDNDVRNALEKGEHLLLDDIFQQVQDAMKAEGFFVKKKTYTSVYGVMEHFLNDLVKSIKGHYTNFEIKEAYSKHKQLWKLEMADVVKRHVERSGLDTLAEQKKNTMINRSWLSEGDVNSVKDKVKGFRDVDEGNYEKLVRKFMETFEGDVKRLLKVDSRRDVLAVRDVVRQIPLFAEVLDGQLSAFKKVWDDIWNSFFDCVAQKIKFAHAPGQEHDISDSISFLQEARKLLQENVSGQAPKAGRNKAKRASKCAPSPGGGIGDAAKAEDGDDFVDAEEDFEEPKCAFSLPFDNGQVHALMEQLNSVLEVDTVQIGADWAQHVEKFDWKAEARSFIDFLDFIRRLKQQAQAIRTCGQYGWGDRPMPPTPDRAVTKVFASVPHQIKALDTSKPEECAVLLLNLERFDEACNEVDDNELQELISNNIKKYCQEVREWVGKVTKEFTEKSTEKYRQAQLEHSPEKRKALLHEVTKIMDQNQLLEEKLWERGLKQNNGTGSPLVAQIMSEISGKTDLTRQALTRNCLVEDVAKSIHEIYVAAMDLGNAFILKHSESCIESILRDCRGSGLGLTELGTVLERDFPQGAQIVSYMPQFTELNRLSFQRMTSGMTPEGTVADVARLNNLDEPRARTLIDLVKQVFAVYDNILRSNRFHYDIPGIVRDIKNQFAIDHKIPALIGGVFAVWSLQSKTDQCPTPNRPLAAQVVAIVRLLALDDQRALDKSRRTWPGISSLLEWWYKSNEKRIDASHLAQIKTGQGKSVVLGTLATVLSLAGFSVDCVCYSAYLSERDQLDFQAIFDLFGVSHMVQYGTFQQLSERLVNSEGDVREMTRDLIMSSTGGPDASTSKPSGANGEQKKRILLVDEVDVFFSRSFYGVTYDPVEYLKIPEITDLQQRAWSMKGDTKQILPALKAMDVYQTLMNRFPDVKDILEAQINIMIRDLEAWEKGDSTEHFRAYKIMDEKVAYKSGVCYNNKITFGYVTLWTYFHEIECKRVPESALEDHLGLMIKCGQFSYAEIPKRYNLILGVTGTLVPEKQGGPHPLGTFEQQIIRNDYKITGMTELPSIYGKRNLTFRENEHVSVQKDEDSYNNAISLEVAKAVEGRAVLVFFETEAKLDEWQNSEYGQRVPACTVECIKSDTRDITIKVRKGTHPGQVTLLSREHGRGLDFRCDNRDLNDRGGLHVVQTFLSEELSEEIQIKGRTARMKNNGSFQMILLAKDLEKFEISDDEIEQKEKGLYVRVAGECNICLEHLSQTCDENRKLPCTHEFHAKCVEQWLSDGHRTCPSCRRDINAPAAAATATSGATQQTLYEFLHEKRAVFLDKSSTTRREAVRCANAMHDQSAAFQRELLAFSQGPTQSLKDKCLPFLRGRNIVQNSQCYHVVFVLDESTSMKGEPWSDLVAAVRSFLEIRTGASTADIISLILFNTSARIACKAMPLADLQSKLEDFLKNPKGGGTSFGPALSCALNVIGEVHHQIGYPPLLMLMSDGGSGDGEPEMSALHTAFPNDGLQVKTMGFGSECDSSKLQKLASLGGGEFSLALNGLELKQCFEQAAASLSYRS